MPLTRKSSAIVPKKQRSIKPLFDILLTSMGKQMPDGEVSRDEVWLALFFILIGVFLCIFGIYQLFTSSISGVLWLAIGVCVAGLSTYVICSRLKRYAEAREEMIWLVLYSIIFID